jgi:hypothetical protein
MEFQELRGSEPDMECLFCNHPAQDHQLCGPHLCDQSGCSCPGFYRAFNSDSERREWERTIAERRTAA